MSENWLVLGAGGFVGSELSVRLLNNGGLCHRLVAVDRHRPSWLERFGDSSAIVFYEEDWLELEPGQIEPIISGSDVWVISASVLPFDVDEAVHSANERIAEKVVHLYDSRRRAGSPPFVIFISSSSIYGFPTELPLSENSRDAPVDKYGESKLAAESIYRRIDPENLAIIRPRTVVGSGRGGTLRLLARLSRMRAPIPVPPETVILQLCHVQDLVSLIVHLGSFRISGLWPAFSNNARSLVGYIRGAKHLETRSKKTVHVPLWTESIFIRIINLGLGPFTAWHVAGFFRSHVFLETWVPPGFRPAHSCQQAFDDSLGSHNG